MTKKKQEFMVDGWKKEIDHMDKGVTKVKPPFKVEWKNVFVVDGWQTEMIKGVGFKIPKSLTDGIITYDDQWLIDLAEDKGLTRHRNGIVFEDEDEAYRELRRQRESYKKHCKEQIIRYNEIIYKIENDPY